MEPVIVDAADGQLAHRKRLRWTSIGWKDAEAKLARCTPWSLTWNSEDEWQRLHNPMALDLQTPIHSRKVSHCPVAFSRATDVFIASLLFPSSRTVGPCPNLTDHGSSPKRRHNAGRPTANDTVLGNLRGTSTAPTVVGEQLQGLPPSYTEDLANGDETRRNIALGNAWRLPTAVWIIFLVLVATAGAGLPRSLRESALDKVIMQFVELPQSPVRTTAAQGSTCCLHATVLLDGTPRVGIASRYQEDPEGPRPTGSCSTRFLDVNKTSSLRSKTWSSTSRSIHHGVVSDAVSACPASLSTRNRSHKYRSASTYSVSYVKHKQKFYTANFHKVFRRWASSPRK